MVLWPQVTCGPVNTSRVKDVGHTVDPWSLPSMEVTACPWFYMALYLFVPVAPKAAGHQLTL